MREDMDAMLSTDAAMIQEQHLDGRQEPKQEHESLPRLCLGSEKALDVRPLAPPRHLRCVEHGLLNEGFAAFGTSWASPFAAPWLLRASRGRALYRTCRHRYRPVQQAMSLRSAMLWIDVRLQRTLKYQRSSRSPSASRGSGTRNRTVSRAELDLWAVLLDQRFEVEGLDDAE